MELRPCPLSFVSEGLEAINHMLSIEFAHTPYQRINAKIDVIMKENGFNQIDGDVYVDANGRKICVCRLGPTIRAIWK